jgi:YidC/Oxa1 family membrane protein insertase
MEKRAIIFIMLSMAVLIAFQYLFAPPGQEQAPSPPEAVPSAPAEQETPPEPVSPVKDTGAKASVAPVTHPEGGEAERSVRVETDLFSAVLSSRGGTMRSFTLKEYTDDDGNPLNILKDTGLYRALAVGSGNDYSYSNLNFEVIGSDLNLGADGAEGSISFAYESPDYTIRRTYTFRPGSYAFDLVDRVEGLPSYSITLGADFGIFDRASRYHHVGPVLLMDSDREEFKPRNLKEPKVFTGNLKWMAIEGKYFFSALVPRGPMAQADVWRYQDSSAISFTGRPGEQSFLVYAGPKQRYELMELGEGLEHIVDFGFFSVIAVPIFWLLKHLYGLVGNYGWSIVFLTIIIRIPFIPLVGKSQRSMKKMQQVQPKVMELKAKYKKNPEKLNQEVMALYKKYKVNPLGGCLPLLLQIPVFFALYKVLLIAIELRSAPWMFWITDLSQKDPYYVLPIIMGASMFLQQKLTPTAGDPKQQKIMQFMPVFFTFLFLSFPSGLVLYWMVNNFLSIVQQVMINRKKEPLEAA